MLCSMGTSAMVHTNITWIWREADIAALTIGLVVECHHLAAVHPELPGTVVGRVDPPCRRVNPAQMISVEAESSGKEDIKLLLECSRSCKLTSETPVDSSWLLFWWLALTWRAFQSRVSEFRPEQNTTA